MELYSTATYTVAVWRLMKLWNNNFSSSFRAFGKKKSKFNVTVFYCTAYGDGRLEIGAVRRTVGRSTYGEMSWTCSIYVASKMHIQGDQKFSVHLMITIQKITSNV
jgi:hypothetical protein